MEHGQLERNGLRYFFWLALSWLALLRTLSDPFFAWRVDGLDRGRLLNPKRFGRDHQLRRRLGLGLEADRHVGNRHRNRRRRRDELGLFRWFLRRLGLAGQPAQRERIVRMLVSGGRRRLRLDADGSVLEDRRAVQNGRRRFDVDIRESRLLSPVLAGFAAELRGGKREQRFGSGLGCPARRRQPAG